ncbi:MAG: hypothetical protein AB7K24_20715 [Gemmataceae bacterium]
MGSDMLVAVNTATATGTTYFGQNVCRRVGSFQPLHRNTGRAFATGELVQTQNLELPQARQTFAVIGSRPTGEWGYDLGLNEQGVAAGCLDYPGKITHVPALTGPDLVRLTLERACSARKGVEILCELISNHGQGSPAAYLIADRGEGYHVAGAGHFWVYQEIGQVRAAGNVCTIHQDWDRISFGLSGHAIDQGWWPGDGSKLDFADAVSGHAMGPESALRRWGRATYLLEQQNGKIDLHFVRRVLADHYEATPFEVNPRAGMVPIPLCRHAVGRDLATLVSVVAQLPATDDALPMLGVAFGPPCMSLHFPVFVDGELPAALTGDGLFAQRMHFLCQRFQQGPEEWHPLHEALLDLQEDFDRESADFARAAAGWKQAGQPIASQTASFMQSCVERFERLLLQAQPNRPATLHVVDPPALPIP